VSLQDLKKPYRVIRAVVARASFKTRYAIAVADRFMETPHGVVLLLATLMAAVVLFGYVVIYSVYSKI